MTKNKTQAGKTNFKSFVEEQVLNKLGKPDNLNFIRASNVFDNRWRVDVWCYHEVEGCLSKTSSSRIEYSYFVRTDEEGKITNSDPEINKEFDDAN
tara:strand:+ start:6230 stop:6517 length:288 start_codon:yes stop_codon:yes gene_type:complete